MNIDKREEEKFGRISLKQYYTNGIETWNKSMVSNKNIVITIEG